MKASRDYIDFLRDIIEMMDKIETFTRGIDYKQFASDDKTYLAVVRALEVIGEAPKHIPSPITKRYPDVPWKRMAGMRDRLIHAYFGTDARIVWETATSLVPVLKPQVIHVLDSEARKS